jgi:hypothetical protein
MTCSTEGEFSCSTIKTGDPQLWSSKTAWVDFTAPPAQKLTYRVVAVNAADDDKGASEPSATITLARLGESG